MALSTLFGVFSTLLTWLVVFLAVFSQEARGSGKPIQFFKKPMSIPYLTCLNILNCTLLYDP